MDREGCEGYIKTALIAHRKMITWILRSSTFRSFLKVKKFADCALAQNRSGASDCVVCAAGDEVLLPNILSYSDLYIEITIPQNVVPQHSCSSLWCALLISEGGETTNVLTLSRTWHIKITKE